MEFSRKRELIHAYLKNIVISIIVDDVNTQCIRKNNVTYQMIYRDDKNPKY